MRKCLIILMGLLTSTSWAGPYDIEGNPPHQTETPDPYLTPTTSDPYRVERETQQRLDNSRKWEPVIVNGPSGARMYYPNGDGTFYQTYDK